MFVWQENPILVTQDFINKENEGTVHVDILGKTPTFQDDKNMPSSLPQELIRKATASGCLYLGDARVSPSRGKQSRSLMWVGG